MKLRGDRPSLTQRSGKTKSPALYWEIAVEFGKKLGRDLDITGLSYALSGRRRLYGDGVFPRLPAARASSPRSTRHPPKRAAVTLVEKLFGSPADTRPGASERAVCACFKVPESAIRSAVAGGATLAKLQKHLKCGDAGMQAGLDKAARIRGRRLFRQKSGRDRPLAPGIPRNVPKRWRPAAHCLLVRISSSSLFTRGRGEKVRAIRSVVRKYCFQRLPSRKPYLGRGPRHRSGARVSFRFPVFPV
jgi:hypothetical protein